MSLTAGTRLGPYEILATLGSGGMGTVYRARDAKLGREVALKVLPDAFVRDEGRVARFKREAQVLASLNHPNIAAIYGIEDSTSVQALVLEFVDGGTLADRIARGPLPADEARSIATQIAEALTAAHEQGVVHRDLKPANIVVRPDGTVKVLDFGLAKALDGQRSAPDVTQSPTLTTPAMTGTGLILGTAAYMSPEQARGRPADHRSDIWTFGAVLYEMLTGRRPFPGETVSDTLASVLKTDPEWQAVPAATPLSLRRVLRSCLEKDPRARLQSIGDWRLLLDEAPSRQVQKLSGIAIAAIAVASLLAVALTVLAVAHFRDRDVAPAIAPLARVTIPLPPGHELDHKVNPVLAMSPDGTRVAYVATQGNATRQLFIRLMDGSETTPIAGTEGALSPFFSPDGQWIGFFAQGKLKKIPTAGGVAQILSDAPSGLGGTAATTTRSTSCPSTPPPCGRWPPAEARPKRSQDWIAPKGK